MRGRSKCLAVTLQGPCPRPRRTPGHPSCLAKQPWSPRADIRVPVVPSHRDCRSRAFHYLSSHSDKNLSCMRVMPQADQGWAAFDLSKDRTARNTRQTPHTVLARLHVDKELGRVALGARLTRADLASRNLRSRHVLQSIISASSISCV